jgi:hypothetical protein
MYFYWLAAINFRKLSSFGVAYGLSNALAARGNLALDTNEQACISLVRNPAAALPRDQLPVMAPLSLKHTEAVSIMSHHRHFV